MVLPESADQFCWFRLGSLMWLHLAGGWLLLPQDLSMHGLSSFRSLAHSVAAGFQEGKPQCASTY